MKAQKVFIYLIISCLGFFGKILAQNPEVADKIIATVDNYIVLKSELDLQFFNLLSEGRIKDTPEARCQLLEQLIVQKMMLAKADIDSVTVEDRQVDSQLDRRVEYIMRSVNGDEKKLEEMYGKSMADIKREIRDQIREQMVVQKMEGKITEKIEITPKEVKKFFNSIPRDSIPQFKTEVQVSHIVKIPGVDKEQKRLTRERAAELRRRIVEGGESFEELAKVYSQDPSSAKEGGNTSWQKRGNFVPEYEAAVFRMKPGEITQPVESAYGFHIIKLLERRGNEYNSQHILLMPDQSQLDISSTEHFLDSIRTLIVRDSIKFEKAAKDFSDDQASKDNGGVIVGPDGSSKVFVDELDSYIYFVIDTMQVGKISRPVPYRTDEGKTGVRIIYYKSKIESHQANINDDYQKIQHFALNNKKNRAINDWFIKTRGQVYINIDPEYKDCKVLEVGAKGY